MLSAGGIQDERYHAGFRGVKQELCLGVFCIAVLDRPIPVDKFTPRLLEVDAPDDLAAKFALARETADGRGPVDAVKGSRRVVILTPGLASVSYPAVADNLIPPSALAFLKSWLGPQNRTITFIGFTFLPGLMEEPGGAEKCIPYLRQLMIIAGAGHNVVVFEGNPSRFETGLRDSDVLMIDSGMRPFLQPDWMSVALRVMRPGARVFFCVREKQNNVVEVISSPQAPGWRWKIVDGEASYAYCLLSVLGKKAGRSAALSTDKAVPDPRSFTTDPVELEWISTFPFHYDRVDASAVIAAILKMARVQDDGPRLIPGLKSHYSFDARLTEQGESGSSFCPFRLTLSGLGSKRHLEIMREEF